MPDLSIRVILVRDVPARDETLRLISASDIMLMMRARDKISSLVLPASSFLIPLDRRTPVIPSVRIMITRYVANIL